MPSSASNLKKVNNGQELHPAGEKKANTHRGFAAMSTEQQRLIASKGGEAVSRDREHMAMIGRKGGEASRGGGRGNNNKTRESE